MKDEQPIEPINEIKLFVPYNLIENKLKENEDKNVKRLMGINVEREFEKEKEEIIKSLKRWKDSLFECITSYEENEYKRTQWDPNKITCK